MWATFKNVLYSHEEENVITGLAEPVFVGCVIFFVIYYDISEV